MGALIMFARIAGTGSYLPEQVRTNADLESMVDTTDAWIFSRTGIRARHIAASNQFSSDLALQASVRALESADFAADKLELIIVATTTPDQIFPSVACLLQEKLGAHKAAAFDVQAVCAGFVYALSVAEKFIKTGAYQSALVVGAETLSRIVDWQDRNTCVLFGDGAGAVLLLPDAECGIISTHLHADGRYKDILNVPGNVDAGAVRGSALLHMDGSAVFKFAVKALGDAAEEALTQAGFAKTDLDWLVPHQANIRIIEATAKRLNLPMDKVIVTVGEHGNTSAASIPLALDVGVRTGKIARGELLLLEGIGGGFAWGSVLLRY